MKSALTISHTSNLKLNKTQSISFPRSGHHLLVDCLIKYFNQEEDSKAIVDKSLFKNTYTANEFVYCEFYNHCRETPCKSSSVNFQKNHDFNLFNSYHQNIFNLNQSNLEIDSNANYLIQFRENPVFSVISEYKRIIKKSVSPKFNAEDSYDFFDAFCADYLDYWVSFINKWILNLPPNAIAFSYESFLEKPHKILTLALKSIGVDEPDLDLIDKIVGNSNIKVKSDITTFKYYQTYLSQLNNKYIQDLKLQLSDNPKLQNTLFLSENNSNSRNMKAKQIVLRENEKMKSNYEKAILFEKALESVEDSLSSKVKIIKLKDAKIEELQSDMLKLNKSLKSSQEGPSEIQKEYEEKIELLKSKLQSATLDKETLVAKIQNYTESSRDHKTAIKQTKSNISSIKNKNKVLKKKNKKLNKLLKDFDVLKSEIRDYQDLISRNKSRIKQLKKKVKKKGENAGNHKKSIQKLTLLNNEIEKLNYQLSNELKEKIKVYEDNTSALHKELNNISLELSTKQNQVKTLESSLNQINLELDENITKLRIAEDNLNISNNIQDKLRSTLDEIQSKYKIQKKKNKQIAVINTTLNKELGKSAQSIKVLESSITSLVAEKKNEEEANKFLSNQISTLENFLNQQITEKKESEDKLQLQLDTKENTITKLISEVEINLIDLKTKTNSVDSLNAEIITAKNDYQDLKDQNLSITNNLEELVSERESLRSFTKSQNNEVILFRSELKTVNTELIELKNKLSRSNEQFSELNFKNKAQHDHIDTLNKSKSKLLRKVLYLESSIKTAEKYDNVHTQKIIELRKVISSLQEELSDKSKVEARLFEMKEELSVSKEQFNELSTLSKKQLNKLSTLNLEQSKQLLYLRDLKSQLFNKVAILESSRDIAENYEKIHTVKIVELRNMILKLQSDLSNNSDVIVDLENINRNAQNKNNKLECLIENNNSELFNRSRLVQKMRIETRNSNEKNLELKSKVYSLESSLKAFKSSYSWKIGYKITRVVFGLFGWTSFIKNRL